MPPTRRRVDDDSSRRRFSCGIGLPRLSSALVKGTRVLYTEPVHPCAHTRRTKKRARAPVGARVGVRSYAGACVFARARECVIHTVYTGELRNAVVLNGSRIERGIQPAWRSIFQAFPKITLADASLGLAGLSGRRGNRGLKGDLRTRDPLIAGR